MKARIGVFLQHDNATQRKSGIIVLLTTIEMKIKKKFPPKMMLSNCGTCDSNNNNKKRIIPPKPFPVMTLLLFWR